MSHPVFISYARGDSTAHALALAKALNGQAFLDTESIDDGDDFPQRLLDALLASRIVVIFGSKTYLERRFCRVEMRLALHAGNESASHIVLAQGEDAQSVLDAMPEHVARTNWPPAGETARLAELARSRLDRNLNPLGSRIPAQEARVVASLFIEEASIPEPRSLQGILVSFPPDSLRKASDEDSSAAPPTYAVFTTLFPRAVEAPPVSPDASLPERASAKPAWPSNT